jgi:hypothetical protein
MQIISKRARSARTLLSLVAHARRRPLLRRAMHKANARTVLPFVAARALRRRVVLNDRPSFRSTSDATPAELLEVTPAQKTSRQRRHRQSE